MNILVWNSWVARPVGGTERIALELALQLRNCEHRVVLVGAYNNAPELRARIPLDMPYYPFDLHRTPIKPHLKAARLLYRIISEHHIDIVSAHGSVIAPYEICRLHAIPLVWTIHGAGSPPSGLIGSLKTMAINRILASTRTHVVAISEATADLIRQYCPRLSESRLHTIHNGAQDEDILKRLSLPQPGPPWHLGYISRLVERKRPLDLIELGKRLNSRLDFKLHVFGDGPLSKPLQELLHTHHLENRFILHGYWDKGSAGMIEQIQVLVHTDGVEPFGLSILESQLGGRPVAAYRVGGIPEIVQHDRTGWLVPLKDFDGLAEGVCILTGDKFRDYCEAARRRSTEVFPMSQMVYKYSELLKDLCAKL